MFTSAADEELFEDNPEEYIRRDIEGSGMSIGSWKPKTVMIPNFWQTDLAKSADLD